MNKKADPFSFGVTEKLQPPIETLIEWKPSHIVPSAWTGHTPFMTWLVSNLKPTRFVELGTHLGMSYFTACDRVAREQLSTQCFAVDSWKGDAQAGFYDESVYETVHGINSQHYSHFSSLKRGLFDEALPDFEDGSIDLLHIDGFHSYEAVRHDFETWLPKLTDDAVVLFHDTCEKQEGFGVYKFWDELSSTYPRSFNFSHSHGLGVLTTSEAETPPSPIFCDEFEIDRFMKYFEIFGVNTVQYVALQLELQRFANEIQIRDARIIELDQSLAIANERLAALDS